jgi:hypothetical protein
MVSVLQPRHQVIEVDRLSKKMRTGKFTHNEIIHFSPTIEKVYDIQQQVIEQRLSPQIPSMFEISSPAGTFAEGKKIQLNTKSHEKMPSGNKYSAPQMSIIND